MTLDEPASEELISDVILKMFKHSEVKPEIRTGRGSYIGNGNMGITSSVEVKTGGEVKHFFLKMAPRNEKLRRTLYAEEIFQREAYFYSQLYRILNDISAKYLRKTFDITPKCFLVQEDRLKEALVLEDIGILGYTTTKTNGKEPLDKTHLMMTLKTYSYLHAYGFLFKRDYPDKWEEMKKINPDLLLKTCKIYDMERLALFGLDRLMPHCSGIEDKVILDNFNQIKNKIMEMESYLTTIEEYSTFIHGDCSKNNMMFKYKDGSNELEDMKLVDMQTWMIHSPVMEILNVICTNVSGEETTDDLDFYFDYYYEALRKCILEMGEDPEAFYPRKVYLSHLKKYCYYGFFMAAGLLRAYLADPKDIPNIVQMILDDEPLSEAFIYELPDEADYSKKLKVILRHFIKNNIF